MPLADLLLREATPPSLTSLVEKSQHVPSPYQSYDLNLSSSHLSLKLLLEKPETPDEGFESDIDSLSLVSNGSYETKTTETDSANGSATSDSDNEEPIRQIEEIYNLVDCVCYNDVTYPDVLLFVIKNEVLVFKFENLNNLKNFYLNFTALKAVTNQKAINKNSGKFNLLQRTDQNGVTHIEITREPELSNLTSRILVTRKTNDIQLKKVWSSADDILSSTPKRPERRKKQKAPPPPVQTTPSAPPSDVLRGEYVRVNVNTDVINKDFIAKSQLKERKTLKPNLVTLFIPKPAKNTQWTNSVPRLLKKQRSKSETRCFTPMAYRYIDTAPIYQPMSERLFGFSSKLRDFGGGRDCQWNNGAELNYKDARGLKSVIKKDEGRKKNEKKVTFSAYTTVQVV